MKFTVAALAALLWSFSLFAVPFDDAKKVEEMLKVTENTGKKIDLKLTFRDPAGREVTLADYFNGKAVVIAPVYYRCPKLCNLTMDGLLKAINKSNYKLGNDYRVLAITINPDETHDLAAAKSAGYFERVKDGAFRTSAQTSKAWQSALASLTAPDAKGLQNFNEKQAQSEKFTFSQLPDSKYSLFEHWTFLTGDYANITAVMKQLGFGYLKNGDDYAHKAVIIFLSPDGTISRYFYGIEFARQDYDLALTDAGKGKTGGIIEQLILSCFRYSSKEGKYTADMWFIMRVSAVVIILLMSVFIYRLWKQGREAR